MIFHNARRVSMALSSQLAMLNTQRPAGERAKRLKWAEEMVSWVQLPPATGYAPPRAMNVNGKEQLIDRTKPGRERMYIYMCVCVYVCVCVYT